MMEKLLLIHSTKETQLQVKNVASRLKLALDIIPEEYCDCRLQELAAGKYAQKPAGACGQVLSGSTMAENTAPAPTDACGQATQVSASLLILCGLRDKRLDKVLFELKRADIPVDYKAILTPSNKEWTVPELMKELQRERQAMGR